MYHSSFFSNSHSVSSSVLRCFLKSFIASFTICFCFSSTDARDRIASILSSKSCCVRLLACESIWWIECMFSCNTPYLDLIFDIFDSCFFCSTSSGGRRPHTVSLLFRFFKKKQLFSHRIRRNRCEDLAGYMMNSTTENTRTQ